MSDIQDLTERIRAFVREREWEQFHDSRSNAISLVLESAELLEHFQWRSGDDPAAQSEEKKGDIADELADVLYWTLLISSYLDIDLAAVFEEKMKKNEKKYPIEKARGRNIKYHALD